MTVAHLVKNFPAFNTTRKNTVFHDLVTENYPK